MNQRVQVRASLFGFVNKRQIVIFRLLQGAQKYMFCICSVKNILIH